MEYVTLKHCFEYGQGQKSQDNLFLGHETSINFQVKALQEN